MNDLIKTELNFVNSARISAGVTDYDTLEPDDHNEINGGVLSDTRLSWVSCGPRLTIINNNDGSIRNGWTFGRIQRDSTVKVTCVTELPLENPSSPILIVGCESAISGGTVCFYHTGSSRVLKAIHFNEKVTSLAVVHANDEPNPHLVRFMKPWSGVIAVGTKLGAVYLIDLWRNGLDKCISDYHFRTYDELHVSQLSLITLEQLDPSLDYRKRSAIHHGGSTPAIYLNGGVLMKQGSFENVQRTKSSCVLSRFPRDQLVVTAIQFFPKICTLAVGYNISCFQLWDLTDFNLLYTSALMEAKLPVCRFGLLEPSDDPRYVCFLWSLHQSSGHQQSLPFGAMYLLNYDSKQNITNYGNLYQDFSSCSLRYEMDFGDEIPSVEDGRIISCRTINKVIPKTIPYSLKDEDASVEESSLSLIAFTWEVWSQNRVKVSNCMTVFDLNQWYQEHMPNSTLTEYDGYMTHLTLKQFEEDTLLDVRIIEQSLKPYIALYHLDQHYYPSSLSFDCVCLYRLNIVHSSRTGVQKACLNAIEKGGPTALLNPAPLFKLCDLAGVKPLLADIHVSYLNNTSVKDQRELVLSVALENSMNGFLWRCVQEWSDGSHAVAGSTLPALLSWAWSRVTLYKLTADKLCVPLFDYTGVRLDFNDRLTLEHCVRQLRNLSKLFHLVIDKFRSFILHDNLEQQYTALSLVSLYLDAVLWFLRNGVLPETLDGDDLSFYSNHHVPYLMNRITGSTKARRVELEHIASSLKTKPPSSGLFFIDALIEQECGGSHLTNQWELEGGATTLGKYPPPSVQSLLRIYLLRGIPTLYKHYVVLYFILDVINHLDSKRYNKHIEKLLMFPTMFGLTESQSRIIQAFWDMDHKHFEEGVDHLLHPNVCKQDLQCYQHRTILCLLVSEGKHKLALRYLNLKKPPLSDDEDIRFEMSLLLSNGLIHEAFSFQRQHQSLQKELLHQFFSKCVEMKKIDAVYKLPLNTVEEMGFTTFLELSQHPKGDDLSVYYLVSRSRYLEAIDLHNKLRSVAASRHRLSKPTPGLTPIGPRGFNIFGTKDNLASGAPNESGLTTRDLIINAISKTLPSITKELAEHCAKEKPVFTSSKRVQRPTPLSVIVHTEISSDRLPHYKTSSSKLMEAALAKTRETWAPLLATPTALKYRLKSNVDDIPFLRTPSGRQRYNPSILNHTLSPVMEGKTKRQHQDNSDYPSKRSRIETMITEDTTETANHDFSCSDSLLLVKTPHVPRAVTSRIKSVLTPQSILKTQGKKTNHMPTTSQLSTPETRNVDAEDIVSARSTPSGRQIRFSLPNEESSSSSPSFEETDLSPNVTPRKPLHRNSLRLSTQSHDLTPGNPRLGRTSLRNSHLNTSLKNDINTVENEVLQSSSHNVSFSPVLSDDVYFSLSSSSSKNTIRDSSSSKDFGSVRSNTKCNLSFGVDEEDVDIDSNEFEPVECVNRTIIGSLHDRKSLLKSQKEIISDDISSDESELENVDNNETLKAPQSLSLYSVLSNSLIEQHRKIQDENIESSAEDVSDEIDNISEDSYDQHTEKSEINVGVKTFQSPHLQTSRSAYETRSFTLNRSIKNEETLKQMEVKSLPELDDKEFENIADDNESLISEDQSFENKNKPNADQILKITEHSMSTNVYDFTVADQNINVQKDNVDEPQEIISSKVVDEEFENIPKDNEFSISEDQSDEELETKESLKTLQSSLLHTSIPAYNKFIFGDPNRSVRDELNQNKSLLLNEKPDVSTKINDIENQQLKSDVDSNVLIEIENKGDDQEEPCDEENFGAEEISSIEDVESGDSVKEVENEVEVRKKARTMHGDMLSKKKSKPVRTTLSMSLPMLSTPRNDSFYGEGTRNKIWKVKRNEENNKREKIVKENEEVKSVMINKEEMESKRDNINIEKEERNSKMVVSTPSRSSKKQILKNCDDVVIEENLGGIDNTLKSVKQTKLDFSTVVEIDAECKSVDDIHGDNEEFDMSLRLDETVLDSSTEISENKINNHQKILEDKNLSKNITQGTVASNTEVNTIVDTINTAHSLELVKISVSVETVKLPKPIDNQISTEDIQNLPSTSANVDIELLQESSDENDKVCLIQSSFTVENANENLFSSDDLQMKERSLEVCSVLEDEDIKEEEEEEEKTYESLKAVYQESDDILGPGDVEESQIPEDDYYNEQGIYEDLIGDDYDQEDEGEKETEIGREEEYTNQSGSSDVICLDSSSGTEPSSAPRPKTKSQKQEHEEYDELYGGLDDDELDYDEYSSSKKSGEELYEEDNEDEEYEEEYVEEEQEEEEGEEYSETGSSSSGSIIEESVGESSTKRERSWKEERQVSEESDEELLEKSDTKMYTSENKNYDIKPDRKMESEVTEMVMKFSDSNKEEILVSNDTNINILGLDATVNDKAQESERKESNEKCLELQNQQIEVEEIMYEDIEEEQNSKTVDIQGNDLLDKIKYKDDECIKLSQESKKEEKIQDDIIEVIEKEQIINTVDNKVIELIGTVKDIDEEYITFQNKDTKKEENIYEDIAEIIEEGQISNISDDKVSELSTKIEDIDEEYIAVQNNEKIIDKNIREIIEEERIVAVDNKVSELVGKIKDIDEEYEKVQSQESKKEDKMDEEVVNEKISQVEVVDKTKTLKYLETLGPSTSRSVQGVGMDIINTHLRIVKMFFENMKDVKTNMKVVSTTPLIDISQIVEHYNNVSKSTIPIIDITESKNIDSVAVKQPEFIDDQFTCISTVGDETQSSSSKEVIQTEFIQEEKKMTDDHESVIVIPHNYQEVFAQQMFDIQSTRTDKVISEVSGSNVELITNEDVVNEGKKDLQITFIDELKECNMLSEHLSEEVVICEEMKTNNNNTLESTVETKRSDSKPVMDTEVKEVENEYSQDIEFIDDQFTCISTVKDETQSSSTKEVIKTEFIQEDGKITDDHVSDVVIGHNYQEMFAQQFDIQSTSTDKVISEMSGSNVELITKEDVVNVGKEDLQITIIGELNECNILSEQLPEEVVICEEIKTNNINTLESNILEQRVDNTVETKRSISKPVRDKEIKEVESEYGQDIKNELQSQVKNISCKEEISVSNKEQCLNEINNKEKNASKDLIQVVNEKEIENFNQKESITEKNQKNECKTQVTGSPLDMVTLREKVREKHVETGSLSALKRHNLRRRSYSDSRNISNKKDNIKLSRKSISVTSILEEPVEGSSFKMVAEQSSFCPQDNTPNIEDFIKYTKSNTESLNVSGVEMLPNLTKENLETVIKIGRRSSISSQQSQSDENDSDKGSLSEVNSIMVEVGSTISDVNSINKTSFHIEPNLNMDQVRPQPRYEMQRRTRSLVKRRLSSLSNIKEIPELTTDNQGSLFKSASTNNVSTENEEPLCRPLKRRSSSVTTWLEFKKVEESNQITTGLSSDSSSYSQIDNPEVFEDPEVKLDRHRQRIRNFRRLSLASYRQSLPRKSSVGKLEELEVVTSSDEDEVTLTKRLRKIKSVESLQQPANSIDSVVSIAGSSHVPSVDQQHTEVIENIYDSDQKSSRSKTIRSKSVSPQIEVESLNLNNKDLRKRRAASEEIRPITRISIKSKGIQTRKWLKQQQIYQAMSNRLTGRSSVLKQNLDPLEVIESDEEIIAVVPSGSHSHQTVIEGKKDNNRKDDENITEELVPIEKVPQKEAGEDTVEQIKTKIVVKPVLKSKTKKEKPTKIAKPKVTKIDITPTKKLKKVVDKREKSDDKELKILEPEEETNKHSKTSKILNKTAKNQNVTFTQEEEQVNKNSSVSETHTNDEERETTRLKEGKNKKSMSKYSQKSQKISTEIRSSNDGGNKKNVNENSELIKKLDEVKQIDKDLSIEIKNKKSNSAETSDTVEEQTMDVDDEPLQALPKKSINVSNKTKINQKKDFVPEKNKDSQLIEDVDTKVEIVTSPTTPKKAKLKKEHAKPNTKNKKSVENVIVEHSNVILETDKSKKVASTIETKTRPVETEKDNEDHNLVVSEKIKRKRKHPKKIIMEVVSEKKIKTNKKGVEKLEKNVKTGKKSKQITKTTDESEGTVVMNEKEIKDVKQRKKAKNTLVEQKAVEKQATTKLTDNFKIGQTGDNEDYESDASSRSTVRTKVKTIWKQQLDNLDSPASRTRRRSVMSDASSVDSKASTITKIDENVSTPERRVTRRQSHLETSGMVTPDTPQSSVIDDYSSQRRLTRKQLALLAHSMESSPNLGAMKRLHDSRLEDVSEESGDEYNKSLSPASSTTTIRSSKRNQDQLSRTYSPARSSRASSTSRK